MCQFTSVLAQKGKDFPDSVIVINDIRVAEHRELLNYCKQQNIPYLRFEGQEPNRYIWNTPETAEWTTDIIKELSEYDAVFTHDYSSYSWRLAKWPELFPLDEYSFLPSGYEVYAHDASSTDLCNREYIVGYAGRIGTIKSSRTHGYHNDILEALRSHKSAVISFTSPSDSEGLVTHQNLSNKDKLFVLGQCKATICHNSGYIINADIGRLNRIHYSWEHKGLRGHPCFKDVCSHAFRSHLLSLKEHSERLNAGFIMPQIRYRMYEAAFSRSVMLVKDDNPDINFFFVPHEEYIPFTSTNLNAIIEDIAVNPSRYQQIADNAYHKAMSHFTVDQFCSKVLKVLEKI